MILGDTHASPASFFALLLNITVACSRRSDSEGAKRKENTLSPIPTPIIHSPLFALRVAPSLSERLEQANITDN